MQPTAQSAVAKSKAATLRSLVAWLSAATAVPILGVFCLPVSWVSGAASVTQTQSVIFSEADLSFTKVGGYDLVALKGARWVNEAGEPRLPLVPVRVSLPAGARVLDVSEVACDSITLPGRFAIYPSQPPQPLSSLGEPEFVKPDPLVYQSGDLYPEELLTLAGAGTLAGTRICEILVHPLRYRPSSGELVLYTQITFSLDCEAGEQSGTERPVSEDMEALARRLVSDRRGSWRSLPRAVRDLAALGGGDVQYLIVTSDALKAAFEPLREWKTRKGLTSETVTIETIISSYAGSDLQEKIRNAINHYYLNYGTEWVLLGGDVQIIPDRKAYVNVSDRPYVPCDLYYSDLDGTWNADGDLYWGETPSDGVDMYADVFVGRAPVATLDEAQAFVRKVLTYEGFYPLPVDYQTDMLFLAGILWGDPDKPSDPDYTDGGIAKSLIDDRYVPSGFAVQKLYQSSGNLSRANALSALDRGVGFVNVLTHGHYKTITLVTESLGNDDFATLTSDSRYGLMYSAACLGGGFDQSDCIGEAWVLSEQGGGFYVGNSRYGWGTPGEPGQGPSDYYDQSFFESVFMTGFLAAGKAHADAKHEYVGESRADAYMRYLMYGLNLLGDPETSLWTSAPRSMVVSCAAAIDTSPQSYAVRVTSGGVPLAGAKVCLWKPGEVYEVGETALDGSVSLPVDASSSGTLHVTVTRANYRPFVGETSVEGAPPHPARPANVAAAEAVGPSVGVTWSPVDDEDLVSYRIFKNTVASPQAYAVVAAPETVYSDPDVVAGTTYYYWVSALDALGNESPVSEACSVAVEGCVSVPDDGHAQAFPILLTPNPFRVSVRLVLEVPGEGPVAARVLGVDARCVAVLDLRETGGGRYEAGWDGRDSFGNRVSPGVYFIESTSSGKSQTRKVLLLK